MTPSNSHIKPKTRTLIAKQTTMPGIYHIATPTNPVATTLNEQIIRNALLRIDWKALENKIN